MIFIFENLKELRKNARSNYEMLLAFIRYEREFAEEFEDWSGGVSCETTMLKIYKCETILKLFGKRVNSFPLNKIAEAITYEYKLVEELPSGSLSDKTSFYYITHKTTYTPYVARLYACFYNWL